MRTSLSKKLFTHSAVESGAERRYIPLIPRPASSGLLTTPGRIPMTKPGIKPSAGKSSSATPRPAPKSMPSPSVAVHPAAKPVPRPVSKAAQTVQSAPAAKQPVAAKLVPRPAPKAAQPAPAAKQPVTARRSTPWTVEAASRIYRTSALENGGQVPKGSFAAEAMSKATKGAPPPKPRAK